MDKSLRIITVLVFALFITGCRNNNKDENVFINEEKIPEFLEKGLLKGMSLKGHIFIDDSLGVKRLNIPVTYKYSYEYWDYIVGYTTFYVLEKNGYINIESDSSFYLSIVYNVPDSNNAALFECFLAESFDKFNHYPRYYTYCQYAVANMWPEDFKVYDLAMEDLFKETGNNLFDSPFYVFFENLSHDDYLSSDEKYVLDELIKWTEERGDFERVKPFEYFLQSFDDGDFKYIEVQDESVY